MVPIKSRNGSVCSDINHFNHFNAYTDNVLDNNLT